MQTLILFKPDCVRRGLVGEILARFERRGLRITELAVRHPGRLELESHYREHREHPVFPALIDMMSEGPLVACILEGDEFTIEVTRALLGDFHGPAPGTIRGDYQTAPMYNLVHASSSLVAARREVELWFPRPGSSGLTTIPA
jgi:nucleoside-diphosphate kinase